MLDRSVDRIVSRIYERYFATHSSMITEDVGSAPANTAPTNPFAGLHFSDITEIQKFLEGKKLPVISNTAKGTYKFSNTNMNFILGIAPKGSATDADGYTFVFSCNPKEDKNTGDFSFEVEASSLASGINVDNFRGNYVKSSDRDFESFYDVVNVSDFDKFFLSYKKDALALVGRRFSAVKHVFNLIESFRVLVIADSKGNVRPATLFVTYNPTKRAFVMGYNPKFILAATLDEWAIKKDQYKDLKTCYIYTLGFLISHEMSHIIRHNTDSTIGTVDINTVNPYLDNIFQDSFINISLGSVFSGLIGNYSHNPVLGSGVGTEFSVRTSLANGGFNSFSSVNEVLKIIAETLQKVTKTPTTFKRYSGSGDNLAPRLANGPTFMKIVCGDRADYFRNNSTLFTSIINSVIKVVLHGDIFDSRTGKTDEEEEAQGLAKENRQDGYLVGLKVEDKTTKKLGVVIEDIAGKLKVSFPDDPKEIMKIIQRLKSEGKVTNPNVDGYFKSGGGF